MRIAVLLPIVAFLSLPAGCYSAVDPGCVSDSECYAGRVCVDGQCTGAADVNRNNVNNSENNENNSENNENNSENNENNSENNQLNNRPENNENNSENNGFNNVANNPVNNVVTPCMSALDCSDDRVCTREGGELRCAEPWSCSGSTGIAEPDFCEVQLECPDDGAFGFLFCEFSDQDEGFCFCEGENFAAEFEAPRGICGNFEGFAELLNTTCGWRVPTEG